MSVVAPFAHAEPVHTSPLEYLTPGGVVCAKLELHSFTTIYAPDDFHYSPAVTIWAVATIKCVKFRGGEFDLSDDSTASAMNRAQLALRSHGQIANLVLDITVPEAFDIISVLGRLQHRQVLLGHTWSVVFKMQPQKKIFLPPNASLRPDGRHYVDPYATASRIWGTRPTNSISPRGENDRLMDEVERMLLPEEEIIAEIQYNHDLFPSSTTVRESASCPIKAITEVERRQRQYYEQRGQAWRQQRGTSALTTTGDLDRDLQMANAICAVLQDGIGAKWPKNPKTSVRYTTVLPKDALQLLADFREAAGATLPQDVTEEMDRLKSVYEQVRKERQEGSFTRKSLKAVLEVGRIARRAVPSMATFSGRYNHQAPSVADSLGPLNPGRATPENRISMYSTSSARERQPWESPVSRRNAFELDRADCSYQATLEDITNHASRVRGVARFIGTLPIVGRRKNARTDTTGKDPDLEKGAREEDAEIKAIWKKVRVISGASSTISDDMERINESNLGGPPWM